MNIRGVILEGNSNSGKTSVLKSLKRCLAKDDESERSIITLGEHYTQVLNKVNGELVRLTYDEHIELLNDRVLEIENLNKWATKLGSASRSSRGLFCIFERFHLNHRNAFVGTQKVEIGNIEDRLRKLNVKCVLLTISEASIRERLNSRDKRSQSLTENEFNKECENYLLEQDRLRNLANRSCIETIEINTDSQKWDRYSTIILDCLN